MRWISTLIVILYINGCIPDKNNQKDNKQFKMDEEKEIQSNLFDSLNEYLTDAIKDIVSIPPERKTELDRIARYISERKEPAKLLFICTHNSRRSHMGQLWAQAAAQYYGLHEQVETFSGGTEVTAFNPRAATALRKAGFQINNPIGMNPKYNVKLSETEVIRCFSKKYDAPTNPSADFAAIMTCSDADKNCPIVRGADNRFSLPYNDPKEADNTTQESLIYNKRCKQIATEMIYLTQNCH